ncbi:hypothetical protein OROMI_028359 [Orobanche minor]
MGTKFMRKSKNNCSSEGWGMDFLLVFFPEEDHVNFSLSSSIKRTISCHLLQKAQSTISICLLLVFTTLLLFALSTLPSVATDSAAARRIYSVSRRDLREFHPPPASPPSNLSRALQGMGTLYRRGTRAMNDVVVAHAPESLSLNELKLFLRLFLRSSLASKADLLLIFPFRTANFDNLILQERDSFFELLTRYKSSNNSHPSASFNVMHFIRIVGKKDRESGETIWGRKARSNHKEESDAESTRTRYGSVVGFDVDELDPGNSLSGFLDHVPISLRRWACYPMLLGRVRRNFKHVMLVDIKDILLLGDPLCRVRNHSPESVILKTQTRCSPGKHGKRKMERFESTRRNLLHPSVVMGGSKGIRRLSNAMFMGIVRASIQHNNNKNKKNVVAESSIFNQLVGNDYLLTNVNLTVSTELPDLSSLSGLGLKSGSHLFVENYGLIKRNSSNVDVINSMVMKHICSFPIDSIVYSDC